MRRLLPDRAQVLALAIACEVAASLALKPALEHPGLYAVVGAGYTASFVLFGEALRRGMPLGLAYGLWSAIGITAVALLATTFLGEQLTLHMAVGMIMVVAGVCLVEFGSRNDSKDRRPLSLRAVRSRHTSLRDET